MRRLTCDLDNRKLKAFYYLSKAFFIDKYKWHSIEIRKSPNNKKNKGRGYHMIIWFYNKIPVMKLRKQLGDDKNRIRIDRKHRKNKQFLFFKKTNTTLEKEFGRPNFEKNLNKNNVSLK